MMVEHTSVQTNLPGIENEGNQSEMFAEFSGKDGKQDTLIEIKPKAKTLDGQIELREEK